MGWIVSPQNSYVEVLTPIILEYDIIGDKIFKEIIKLNRGCYGGP